MELLQQNVLRFFIALIQCVNNAVLSTRVLIRGGGHEHWPQSIERFEYLWPTLSKLRQNVVEKLRMLVDELPEESSDDRRSRVPLIEARIAEKICKRISIFH